MAEEVNCNDVISGAIAILVIFITVVSLIAYAWPEQGNSAGIVINAAHGLIAMFNGNAPIPVLATRSANTLATTSHLTTSALTSLVDVSFATRALDWIAPFIPAPLLAFTSVAKGLYWAADRITSSSLSSSQFATSSTGAARPRTVIVDPLVAQSQTLATQFKQSSWWGTSSSVVKQITTVIDIRTPSDPHAIYNASVLIVSAPLQCKQRFIQVLVGDYDYSSLLDVQFDDPGIHVLLWCIGARNGKRDLQRDEWILIGYGRVDPAVGVLHIGLTHLFRNGAFAELLSLGAAPSTIPGSPPYQLATIASLHPSRYFSQKSIWRQADQLNVVSPVQSNFIVLDYDGSNEKIASPTALIDAYLKSLHYTLEKKWIRWMRKHIVSFECHPHLLDEVSDDDYETADTFLNRDGATGRIASAKLPAQMLSITSYFTVVLWSSHEIAVQRVHHDHYDTAVVVINDMEQFLMFESARDAVPSYEPTSTVDRFEKLLRTHVRRLESRFDQRVTDSVFDFIDAPTHANVKPKCPMRAFQSSGLGANLGLGLGLGSGTLSSRLICNNAAISPSFLIAAPGIGHGPRFVRWITFLSTVFSSGDDAKSQLYEVYAEMSMRCSPIGNEDHAFHWNAEQALETVHAIDQQFGFDATTRAPIRPAADTKPVQKTPVDSRFSFDRLLGRRTHVDGREPSQRPPVRSKNVATDASSSSKNAEAPKLSMEQCDEASYHFALLLMIQHGALEGWMIQSQGTTIIRSELAQDDNKKVSRSELAQDDNNKVSRSELAQDDNNKVLQSAFNTPSGKCDAHHTFTVGTPMTPEEWQESSPYWCADDDSHQFYDAPLFGTTGALRAINLKELGVSYPVAHFARNYHYPWVMRCGA